MNSPATARSPGRSRLALIVAGVLALLGSFVVTAPVQAGYYGESDYGYRLPFQFPTKPCLRASLRRTTICGTALQLASSPLPPSLRLQSVRLSILVEAAPVGLWRYRTPLANAL